MLKSQLTSALSWRLQRGLLQRKGATEPSAAHLVLEWDVGKDATVVQIEI